MAKKPINFDEIAILGIIMLFLMINYSMPLSSIYSSMIYLLLFLYLVPLMFNLFNWIPISNKANRINEIIAGVAAAIGFIWFYNNILTASPMATVFATTAFGESVGMGKFVFGLQIPIIETVFFFVILPIWALWKMGKTLKKELSMDNIILMIAFSAIFTIFHATSKGLTNNMDLMATAVFGVLSIGLIIYFGSVLPALILHIAVNSFSIGVLEGITGWITNVSPMWIIGIVVIGYFIFRKSNFRLSKVLG